MRSKKNSAILEHFFSVVFFLETQSRSNCCGHFGHHCVTMFWMCENEAVACKQACYFENGHIF